MLRILALSLLAIAVMAGIKDGRMLERAGLVGSCTPVATPEGQTGYWHSCKEGRLEGRPDLTRKSCKSIGLVGSLEYWRCPTPLGGLKNAAGWQGSRTG
jgi:hypothetical protein